MRGRGGSCVDAWDEYFTGWTCGAEAAPVSARGMKYMRLSTPSCSSIPLRSISLTGFALCEWPYAAPLTCQHDVALHMSLHALLIAYLDYTTNTKLVKDLAKCFGMYSH